MNDKKILNIAVHILTCVTSVEIVILFKQIFLTVMLVNWYLQQPITIFDFIKLWNPFTEKHKSCIPPC